MPPVKTCMTCSYFKPESEHSKIYCCKRYPPNINNCFPKPSGDNWCGEYNEANPVVGGPEMY